jgi:hypothetical protein
LLAPASGPACGAGVTRWSKAVAIAVNDGPAGFGASPNARLIFDALPTECRACAVRAARVG